MKKGIIAISLLLTGALLITPITNAIGQSDVKTSSNVAVQAEQAVKTEKVEVSSESNDKTTQTNDIDNGKDTSKENTIKENSDKSDQKVAVKEDITKVESSKENITEDKVENTTEETQAPEEEKEDMGMSKSEAEAVLNKYIKEVEKADFTYTYQGDENTFEVIQNKGIRGYVFLPNVDTDMAYLVDKDSGEIYFFHPSGYFELLQ